MELENNSLNTRIAIVGLFLLLMACSTPNKIKSERQRLNEVHGLNGAIPMDNFHLIFFNPRPIYEK